MQGTTLLLQSSGGGGERFPSFLKPGQATARITYNKYSSNNLSLRTDYRLGDDTWLSASYLNVLLHNAMSAILFSPEEWFVLGAELGKLNCLAREGKKLIKLRNWEDHCLPVGEVLFASSKEAGAVWVAKKGNILHLSMGECSEVRTLKVLPTKIL